MHRQHVYLLIIAGLVACNLTQAIRFNELVNTFNDNFLDIDDRLTYLEQTDNENDTVTIDQINEEDTLTYEKVYVIKHSTENY